MRESHFRFLVTAVNSVSVVIAGVDLFCLSLDPSFCWCFQCAGLGVKGEASFHGD